MDEDEPIMNLATSEQSVIAGDGGKKKKIMREAAVAIYGTMIFVVLLVNILIVIGIARGRLIQRTKVNIYLLSLVISRMLIAVFVLPAQITARFSEKYIITSLCKLCHFTAMGSSAVSVMSTTAIAIVKYREFIVHRGRVNMSTKVIARDLVIIWVLGHVYSIRAVIFNDLFYDEGLQMWRCGITHDYLHINSYFLFLDLACMFVIPLLIVSVCYTKLIKHLRKTHSMANTKPPITDVSTISTGDPYENPKTMVIANTVAIDANLIVARNRKSIQMILIVVSLFTICSVTPLALKLYRFFVEPFPEYTLVELILFIISYSNAWLNALVILAFRDDIRRGLTSRPELDDSMDTDLSSRDVLLRTD